MGDSIQGNFIGKYFLYPVNATTGLPLAAPDLILAGLGNSLGIIVDANNTTIGGTDPDNVIAGNGQQGIWLQVHATGNVVEANEIGMIGPAGNGLYAQVGDGQESSSRDRATRSACRQPAMPDSGKRQVRCGFCAGAAATRTIVAANLMGLAPGGGFRFGTGVPGNGGDGVRMDASMNQVGGPDKIWQNEISSNAGSGVSVAGCRVDRQSRGQQPDRADCRRQGRRGKHRGWREHLLAQNTIGPGNVISGNTNGVSISSRHFRDRQPGRRQPDRHRFERCDRPGQRP